MGFYGSEPFKTATASYVWIDPEAPGFYYVEVKGEAPNYSYGFKLVRDADWVGGLKVNVKGWTGPFGEGTTPYKVEGHFPGEFSPKIIVSGSNGQQVINVSEISHEGAEDWMKSKAT